MIIYYDNTTTERYREITARGGDGYPREGMQTVDVSWPVEYGRKSEVLYDTQESEIVGADTIITQKQRDRIRDEVLDIASRVFMFVDSAQINASLNFLKARIYIIMNSTDKQEIKGVVQQIKNQAENILDSLNDYTP